METPLVSVVIPTRNRFKQLCDLIDSILSSSYKNIEIIVVDDASIDETKNSLDLIYKNKINVIHLATHSFMVKTRNTGAKAANGEYILFIDDDNVIDKEMITNLLICSRSNKKYGMIGPLMFYFDKKDLIWFFGSKYNMWSGKTTYINQNQIIANIDGASTIESEGIPNAFLIKRDVFKIAGYFDEELLQTWTETDFSFRIKDYDYKTIICPSAIIYHRVPINDKYQRIISGGGYKYKSYFLIRNRFVFMMRHANGIQRVFFILTFSWIFPAIYSLIAIRYNRYDVAVMYWKGFVDGIYYILTNKIRNGIGSK